MTLEDLYRLMRSGHVQAQGVVDTMADPLLVLDESLEVCVVNPAFLQVFGLERDAVLGQSLFHLGQEQWNTPELRVLLSDIIPKAHAIVDYEVRPNGPTHGGRTFLLSARRLSHPDGNSPNLFLVFRDVTEAGRASAQRDILLAESQHRMKNLMAVVQALVSRTKAAGRTGEEFQSALLGRLAVLMAAQEIELGEAGAEATLPTLVARTLTPFLQQVRVAPGPDVPLTSDQVLPLSLVLHELSTNAAKYGALSTPEGVVELRWELAPKDSVLMLALDWLEMGGPPVAPPSQAGFGTRLIEMSVHSDLGGRVERRYEPAGLQIRIEVPLI